MLGNGTPTLSIIVPVLNESESLFEMHRRLASVLDAQDFDAEIIFVNDGSTDDSIDVIHQICELDHRAGVVDLSRRFGKEIAMSAGLDHSTGDAVVLIDADLQDPPEYIPQMVAAWKSGFDVVAMQTIAPYPTKRP